MAIDQDYIQFMILMKNSDNITSGCCFPEISEIILPKYSLHRSTTIELFTVIFSPLFFTIRDGVWGFFGSCFLSEISRGYSHWQFIRVPEAEE